MITEKIYYGVKCDACGKELEDGDGCLHYNEEDYMESIALDSEWIKVRDKHYCENCYKYGDNDELILADGVVIEYGNVDWI